MAHRRLACAKYEQLSAISSSRKIATSAEFHRTRWPANAVIMQTPQVVSYLMPVGGAVRLSKTPNGAQGLGLKSCSSDLALATSGAGNRVFLDFTNLNFGLPTRGSFAVGFSKLDRRICGRVLTKTSPEKFNPEE